MSWKCDKCKNTYSDNVEKTNSAGFNFCPACVSGEEIAESEIVKKNKTPYYTKALLICAIVVFAGSVIAGIFFIQNALTVVSIPVWVGGFVVAVVLAGVSEFILKRK